jgi:hypothetical protein
MTFTTMKPAAIATAAGPDLHCIVVVRADADAPTLRWWRRRAPQANDMALRKMADRIQARAIRRCGELLAQIKPARASLASPERRRQRSRWRDSK